MTGSITGMTEVGLNGGFKPAVMVGVGGPDGIVFATSGTLLRDVTNDALYMNSTVAGIGAGSTWQTYT